MRVKLTREQVVAALESHVGKFFPDTKVVAENEYYLPTDLEFTIINLAPAVVPEPEPSLEPVNPPPIDDVPF